MANGGIKTRDDLLYNLAVACELPAPASASSIYSGAFSLKTSLAEEGLNTQEQLNFVRKWKANIFHVGAQEMLHLTLAANLCTAAGGVVQLGPPDLASAPTLLPNQAALAPLIPSPSTRSGATATTNGRNNLDHPYDPWNDRPMQLSDTVPEHVKHDVDRHDPLSYLRTAPLPEAQKKLSCGPGGDHRRSLRRDQEGLPRGCRV